MRDNTTARLHSAGSLSPDRMTTELVGVPRT